MKKVVIFCPYSYPSACGIWSRVYSDALALQKAGFDVSIFSSNIIKGTDKTSESFENLGGIKLYRFKVLLRLGGTSMFWSFYSKLKEVNPDIIHTHGYRHPHSLFSLIWGKFNSKKVILTTHAPFEKDSKRLLFLKLIDIFYDLFIGWWELKLYTKVIRISNWEVLYLEKLGIKNSLLLPNGLKDIFLTNKPEINKIKLSSAIYLGRIDPVKRLEWIIQAAKTLKNIKFKIVGPLSGYKSFDYSIDNLQVDAKNYSSEDFISECKNSDIYILPSVREAMPFTLLEAMSCGKFVISSRSNGAKEVIKDNENGFLISSENELIDKLNYIYNNWNELQFIRYNARSTAENYSAEDSNKKLIDLYNNF